MSPLLGDPVFWLAAIPAVSIVGLSKGGFVGLAVLGTPLLALAMSPVQAAAMLLPILIVQDMVSVWAYRRSYAPRIVAIALTGALIGTVLGAGLAAYVTDAHVRLAVGSVALAFALNWFLNGAARAADGPKPGRVAGVFWGTVSGFTSFISHAGGPPFQFYVLPQRLPRDVLVGTTTWFFAIINWVKVPPYLWLGQFTRDTLILSAALLPVAIASTLAGVWLVRRVDSARFYRIVYVLLALVGVKLIWDGARALL